MILRYVMAYATVHEIVLQSIVAWAQGLSIHDLCSCKLLVRSSGRASCDLFGVSCYLLARSCIMPFVWLAAEGVEAELLTQERRSNRALVLDITMSTLYWLLTGFNYIYILDIKEQTILSIIHILLSKMSICLYPVCSPNS